MSITSDQAVIYRVHASGAKRVASYPHAHLPTSVPATSPPHANTHHADLLEPWVRQNPQLPWVLLVDHSEEVFWFETMPRLTGAAKIAWMQQLAQQQNPSERTYTWMQVQGAHRQEASRREVLGYSLGFFDGVQPWLDALYALQARVRALYAPCLLARQALLDVNRTLSKCLKTKRPKSFKYFKYFQPFPYLPHFKSTKQPNAIRVLVTPCVEGLRQVVVIGAYVRFSRVAMDASLKQTGNWQVAVCRESSKLREYLVGSRILQGDQTEIDFYVVSPNAADFDRPANNHHAIDACAFHRYHWLDAPHADLFYVQAALNMPPWQGQAQQMALPMYRAHDQKMRGRRAIHGVSAVLGVALAVYGAQMGYRLWDAHRQTQDLLAQTTKMTQQYQQVVKTFPPSPLSSQQLAQLNTHWQTLEQHALPQMLPVLRVAGQVLQQHPTVVVERLQWMAHDVPYAPQPSHAPALASVTASAPAPAATAMPMPMPAPEKAALVLVGQIQGVGSHDLRGARAALLQLQASFNQHAGFDAQILKNPFEMSAQAHVSGNSQPAPFELTFEIKIRQH